MYRLIKQNSDIPILHFRCGSAEGSTVHAVDTVVKQQTAAPAPRRSKRKGNAAAGSNDLTSTKVALKLEPAESVTGRPRRSTRRMAAKAMRGTVIKEEVCSDPEWSPAGRETKATQKASQERKVSHPRTGYVALEQSGLLRQLKPRALSV